MDEKVPSVVKMAPFNWADTVSAEVILPSTRRQQTCSPNSWDGSSTDTKKSSKKRVSFKEDDVLVNVIEIPKRGSSPLEQELEPCDPQKLVEDMHLENLSLYGSKYDLHQPGSQYYSKQYFGDAQTFFRGPYSGYMPIKANVFYGKRIYMSEANPGALSRGKHHRDKPSKPSRPVTQPEVVSSKAEVDFSEDLVTKSAPIKSMVGSQRQNMLCRSKFGQLKLREKSFSRSEPKRADHGISIGEVTGQGLPQVHVSPYRQQTTQLSKDRVQSAPLGFRNGDVISGRSHDTNNNLPVLETKNTKSRTLYVASKQSPRLDPPKVDQIWN